MPVPADADEVDAADGASGRWSSRTLPLSSAMRHGVRSSSPSASSTRVVEARAEARGSARSARPSAVAVGARAPRRARGRRSIHRLVPVKPRWPTAPGRRRRRGAARARTPSASPSGVSKPERAGAAGRRRRAGARLPQRRRREPPAPRELVEHGLAEAGHVVRGAEEPGVAGDPVHHPGVVVVDLAGPREARPAGRPTAPPGPGPARAGACASRWAPAPGRPAAGSR